MFPPNNSYASSNLFLKKSVFGEVLWNMEVPRKTAVQNAQFFCCFCSSELIQLMNANRVQWNVTFNFGIKNLENAIFCAICFSGTRWGKYGQDFFKCKIDSIVCPIMIEINKKFVICFLDICIIGCFREVSAKVWFMLYLDCKTVLFRFWDCIRIVADGQNLRFSGQPFVHEALNWEELSFCSLSRANIKKHTNIRSWQKAVRFPMSGFFAMFHQYCSGVGAK